MSTFSTRYFFCVLATFILTASKVGLLLLNLFQLLTYRQRDSHLLAFLLIFKNMWRENTTNWTHFGHFTLFYNSIFFTNICSLLGGFLFCFWISVWKYKNDECTLSVVSFSLFFIIVINIAYIALRWWYSHFVQEKWRKEENERENSNFTISLSVRALQYARMYIYVMLHIRIQTVPGE